jgi:hypothetical protein
MMKKIDLPYPKELFAVDSETLDRVSSVFAGTFISMTLALDPNKGTIRQGTSHREDDPDYVSKRQQFTDIIGPILADSCDWMGVDTVRATVDCRVVQPYKAQRGGYWHTDHKKGVLMCDALPPQFVGGTVAMRSKLGQAYLQRAQPYGERPLALETRLAIERKQLEPMDAMPHMALGFTDAHLHQGSVNDSEEPLLRCFVRLQDTDEPV